MKKTVSAAKKLLLSTERVRSLDPAAMRTVKGAALVACGATAVLCPNYSIAPDPPPCTVSCTIGGLTTVRCIGTENR